MSSEYHRERASSELNVSTNGDDRFFTKMYSVRCMMSGHYVIVGSTRFKISLKWRELWTNQNESYCTVLIHAWQAIVFNQSCEVCYVGIYSSELKRCKARRNTQTVDDIKRKNNKTTWDSYVHYIRMERVYVYRESISTYTAYVKY